MSDEQMQRIAIGQIVAVNVVLSPVPEAGYVEVTARVPDVGLFNVEVGDWVELSWPGSPPLRNETAWSEAKR